jgi:D-cysteine desulfhydrase family pyridoxal phosphate-dependent enzyme
MAIPRFHFAHLPTPIEELPRLSEALGGARLLIKRDDQTGLAFGGNKTRKLEFLVAEARDQGAKTLITGGALQSNHCRQTAAAAARLGFKCILVLTGDKPKHPSGNLLLDQLFGAEIVYVADRKDRDRILQETFDRAGKDGMKPYLVPYGGSSPTGALGYAFAMKELIDQNIGADWIVFATSSGGTHAGLLLGQRIFGFSGKILGISVDEPEEWLKKEVSQLASAISEKVGERIEFMPSDVLVNANYCDAGYGIVTEREREAIRLLASCEGLLLDPVYTGRAAAGMIDLIRKGFFKRDETVLFLHTGGLPALFAEQYTDKLR